MALRVGSELDMHAETCRLLSHEVMYENLAIGVLAFFFFSSLYPLLLKLWLMELGTLGDWNHNASCKFENIETSDETEEVCKQTASCRLVSFLLYIFLSFPGLLFLLFVIS